MVSRPLPGPASAPSFGAGRVWAQPPGREDFAEPGSPRPHSVGLTFPHKVGPGGACAAPSSRTTVPAASPGPLPAHTAPARSGAAHHQVAGARGPRGRLLAAALAVRRPQDSWAPPRAGRDPLVACPGGLPGSVGGVETAPLPAGHPAEPVPGGDAAAPRGAWQDPQFALGRKGWGVGLHGAHSPPAGDAAAPVGRGTSRATCGAAGQRSPWPPTPSPCSAWPARCPAASCTCTATTTCTGEGGR